MIRGMPLNPAVREPAARAAKAGGVTLRGHAVATARDIMRLDVSVDGGRTWKQAEPKQGGGAPWSWTLWNATPELPKDEHEVIVRGWGSAGQTQPAQPDDVWKFKGYLSAAWHRLHVSAG